MEQFKIRPSLYDLGLDVIAIIVSYIHDPDDLDSLYSADPWLFINIYKKCVTKLYKDPEVIDFVNIDVLQKYPCLTIARCDLRVENYTELYKVLDSRLIQACIRIGSTSGPSILTTVYRLVDNGFNKSYRIERYNDRTSELEIVWLGEGKFSTSTRYLFSYLLVCRNYIEEITVETCCWSNIEYLELFERLTNLTKIFYIDVGFSPCLSIELYEMLSINDNIDSITCLPCSYMYTIDPVNKWMEVDEFIEIITEEVFPKIKTLYLYNNIIYIDSINLTFPNLENIGFRYIHEVIRPYEPINKISLRPLLKYNFKKYKKVRIYLYIDLSGCIEEFNREPELPVLIGRNIINYFKNSKIEVIDMNLLKDSDIVVLDNWMFEK